MNPIYPGTPDCPWPYTYRFWNGWTMIKPESEGKYIVYDGTIEEVATYVNDNFICDKIRTVIGWREIDSSGIKEVERFHR